MERANSELLASGGRRHHRVERIVALTDREREVAFAVADGRTNKQIAVHLNVSAKTVEFHLRNAFAKLAVSNRTELPSAMRDLVS